MAVGPIKLARTQIGEIHVSVDQLQGRNISGAAPNDGDSFEWSSSQGEYILTQDHDNDIRKQTWFNYRLSGFDFTIPAPDTLNYTIGAGTAVVNGKYVSAEAYSASSLANNMVYDLWLNDDGSYTVESLPSDQYTSMPLHTDKLCIVRVQTENSPETGNPSITGIFSKSNDFPTELSSVEQSLNLADFVKNFFWIPTNVTTWTASTNYNVGDIYITPSGKRIYYVVVAGTSGTSEPTGTYGPAPSFFITDGTCDVTLFGDDVHQGSFRWGKANGTEHYFQNLGLKNVVPWLLAYPNPTDGAITDMILSHIKWVLKTVANTRQNSATYQRGMYIIAAGFYWLCTTGGTTASGSAFTGTYSVGNTVTDGGASFQAVYPYYTSGTTAVSWVWLDLLQDFLTYKYPDSHDSYASSLATLINEYVKLTGNISWLSDASPQPGLTYYQVFTNIMNYNLVNQMYNGTVNLTNTFQNQVAPWDGSIYNISYLEDNCESYQGLIAAANIATLMGDSSNASTYSTTAANVASAIYQNFYGTSTAGNSFFLYVYPTTDTHDTVDANLPNTMQWYPNLQPNFWPEVCGLPFDNSVFYSARSWVALKWPSYWTDYSKDTGFPNLFVALIAAQKWHKHDIAQQALALAERFTIPATGASAMTIDEFGRYLKVKDLLLPSNELMTLDAKGIVIENDDAVTSLPLPPSNGVVATGTYSANWGDSILASTSGGAVTVNLPSALNGVNKSPIFVSKYGSDANAVTVQETGSGFSHTLSHDGDGVTVQISSGVWTIISQVSTVAGAGTVTSVGLSEGAIFSVSGSPVTTSGTLTLSLLTQSANTVFAGPTTGSAAAPTFRALVAADIPSLDASKITTGYLSVARGGTGSDLSGTGGTSQVLKQTSAGAAITVGQLAASDLSNGTTGSGNVVLATSPTFGGPTISGTVALNSASNLAWNSDIYVSRNGAGILAVGTTSGGIDGTLLCGSIQDLSTVVSWYPGDVGLSRTAAGVLAVGNGSNGDTSGELVAGSCAIGGGTKVTKIAVFSVSWTPASVGATTSAEQTVTVTGLTTADKIVAVNPPSAHPAGCLQGSARASASNTLAVQFGNVTSSSKTPASGTYQVVALRS
jgi:hypothetical protein